MKNINWKILLLILIVALGAFFTISQSEREKPFDDKTASEQASTTEGQELVIKTDIWYGTPIKIDVSGDFRFNRTDKDGNPIKDSHWFWATATGIGSTITNEEVFGILSANPKGIYELVGLEIQGPCSSFTAEQAKEECGPEIFIDDITLVK